MMMIASVRGILTHKSLTSVVIHTGGIGFQILIPVSSHEALGKVGEEVSLLTYLHVREDVLQLYGFATEAERELFLSLITVSGIGPKLAQSVLSGISVKDFRLAVQQQDIAALSRVRGIGKKTAERLVVELREKIASPECNMDLLSTHRPARRPSEPCFLWVQTPFCRNRCIQTAQAGCFSVHRRTDTSGAEGAVMDFRITVPEPIEGDQAFDLTLRPRQLSEFVGQEKIVENLRIFIQAAKERGEALDHVLFYGARVWAKPHWPIFWPMNFLWN